MSTIEINGNYFGEKQKQENYAAEFLKRELNEHKNRFVLDHPDGCVTEEKLSAELRDTLALNSSGVENHEIRVKILEKNSHNHTNKEILDGITEIPIARKEVLMLVSDVQSMVWEVNNKKAEKTEFETLSESISNHEGHISNLLTLTSAHEGDIVRIDAEKADKSEVYTKEETDGKLEGKAEKSDVRTLREDITIASEHVRNHDTDIRNLENNKVDKEEWGDVNAALDNIIAIQNSLTGGGSE